MYVFLLACVCRWSPIGSSIADFCVIVLHAHHGYTFYHFMLARLAWLNHRIGVLRLFWRLVGVQEIAKTCVPSVVKGNKQHIGWLAVRISASQRRVHACLCACIKCTRLRVCVCVLLLNDECCEVIARVLTHKSTYEHGHNMCVCVCVCREELYG